jgi:hypothetical protein
MKSSFLVHFDQAGLRRECHRLIGDIDRRKICLADSGDEFSDSRATRGLVAIHHSYQSALAGKGLGDALSDSRVPAPVTRAV